MTGAEKKGVRDIIAELADGRVNAAKLKAGARIREDLGFDSILLIDLMVELEARFGLYFEPLSPEMDTVFTTVGALEAFVKANGKKE